jgi:hypothetical protein
MSKPATDPTPQTSIEARDLIAELQTKRAGLAAVVASTAERLKGHAVAAEFGNAAAKKTLRQIRDEDTEARLALSNLDMAIENMVALRDTLSANESEESKREGAQELSDAVDELLAVADEIDDKADELRALLLQFDELKVHPVLRHAYRAKLGTNYALVPEARSVGRSLLAYFDRWMPDAQGATFESITRVAEWASHNCGKVSPRMQARPPRALSMIEANMLRALGFPYRGAAGLDSTVENQKFHASGGKRRPTAASEDHPTVGSTGRATDDRQFERDFERRMVTGGR